MWVTVARGDVKAGGREMEDTYRKDVGKPVECCCSWLCVVCNREQ